jgi:endoglucanase
MPAFLGLFLPLGFQPLQAKSRFLRADVNQDGRVDLSDGIAVLDFLFTGSRTLGCLEAADINDSGSLDLSDPVFLFDFLFLGGSGVQPPYPECGEDPTADGLGCQASPCPEPRPLPQLPLRTSGRWILDAGGQRFKFAGVNWYGAEEDDFVVAGLDHEPLSTIARRIRELGFNSVRIPWSNELVARNPVVPAAALGANPTLEGKRALEVLDAVVDGLAFEGLLVILDNHSSDAGWCCSDTDGNGLWYNAAYPEAVWLEHWRLLTRRYLDRPSVAAMDLRNEPRSGASWGGEARLDWKSAAGRAADAILAINREVLIVVEGTSYATDLGGVFQDPLVLKVPGRLVYSAHDYSWFHGALASYDDLKTQLGNRWGFILTQGRAFTAPVLVSEFGTCNTAGSCVADPSGPGFWFAAFRRYLGEADIDWTYWALNGTQARAAGRTFGAPETFGVMAADWYAAASAGLLQSLEALVAITQRP